MSDTVKDLKAKWQDAEAEAIKLQNEKDEAIDKARAKYAKRQRTAVDKAAAAQKAYLDAEAANALLDRPDGAQLAQQRINDGGLSAEAVKAVGLELPA